MRKKTVFTALLFFLWQACALAAMAYLAMPWAVAVPVLLSVIFGGVILWYWGAYYRLLHGDSEQRILDAIRQLDTARMEANEDPLTGLHTRRYLEERLNESLAVAMDRGHQCAVLLLDLDFFKDINQALGYQLGNQLIAAIGARLDSAVKKGDLLGYYGADEFIVVLPEIRDGMAAELVARRFLTALSEPLAVSGHSLSVSASIGISVGPEDGTEGESLVRHAESALAQCKAQGRKGYRFFTPAMNQSAAERLKIDQQLRGALERNEFSLFYQPIVTCSDHSLIGAEALIRWDNPELGRVSPSDFITIAEQIGFITDIGNWVLNEATAQVLVWQQRYGRHLVMSVNVSPRQFHDGSIVAEARSVITRLGLDPRCLQLEVTEGLLMNASQRLMDDLTTLTRSGVHLALDDFGTGFSSLSYLRNLPFDVLKIDQNFIRELKNRPQAETMVEAMVRMGHSLDMKVVAEGVETLEQATRLYRLEVDSLQGFYFSRPLPPCDFERHYLTRSQSMPSSGERSIRGGR